jgi:HAE1 family hydrophobic/amphiphilic exporter-1
VTFAWGTDVDIAATEVRARLDAERDELPDGVERIQVRKFDVNSFPVVLLGIASDLDPVELTMLIDEQVSQRFARVPGVAQVDVWGGYAREVRVELDPERVRALALPMNQVLAALRDANLDLPAGEIEAGRYEVTLRAPAEFASVEDVRATVVANRDGAAVTLGQIAEVRDTYERLTRLVRVNGQLGLRMAVRKQADANTVEVSQGVLAEIERVNRDFPQVRVVPVINQGNFIERSIRNVATSVVYGGGLAVLVLLFFLRDLRSTAVISLAIPISVVATIALLYFSGFTLNLMTLGGLALGVGMMVDSSIVVLENIFRRHDEEGLAPAEAAVQGAREVGPAIVASTLTTLVIFLPVVFIRGVSGLLFQELAYVIVFSLACSLAVSLSVVPMLAARMLRSREGVRGRPAGLAARTASRLGAWGGGVLDALNTRYRDLLRFVLRHRVATVAAMALAFAASMTLVPRLGSEFLPPSDEGEVRITGEMEVGTRLGIVDRQTRLIEDVVMDSVPERVAWVTTVGASGRDPNQGSTGEIRLSLVPASQRDRSNTQIAAELRERLEGVVPGMEVRTRAPQGQFLLERLLGGEDGVTIEVRGFDLDTLGLLTERVAEAVAEIPGVTDVDTSRNLGTPQERLTIDRAKAADLGISVRDIVQVLETGVAGSRAGDFRPLGQSYPILVQLRDARDLPLETILGLTVRSAAGEDVALRSLVRSEPGRGPTVIERRDQQRVYTVTANVAGRDQGSVARDVEGALAEIVRPTGYELRLAGAIEEQRESSRELAISLVLALVLVYMVLACQYESLRDPLIVMLAVPLAAIGVVIVLFLTGTTINIQSAIGCIMLGGIAVNNAILLVDQASLLRRRDGMGVAEAVAEAGRRRLRPILMTSLTTILGLMPLAIGIGEGADAQAPLARAVVGGLISSMLATLLLVPAAYAIMHARTARNANRAG